MIELFAVLVLAEQAIAESTAGAVFVKLQAAVEELARRRMALKRNGCAAVS